MPAALPRIHVGDNRRFLATESGDPFFWLGDTAWELFHRTTIEEAETYLENRRRKGFSVIQAVALAELDGLPAPNTSGHTPLIDLDPTQPNEAYFHYVDAVIDLAAGKGLYIGLLPTWGDKVVALWGVGPVVFDESNAYCYGQWLGARYRERSNILWILAVLHPRPRPGAAALRRGRARPARTGDARRRGPLRLRLHPQPRPGRAAGSHCNCRRERPGLLVRSAQRPINGARRLSDQRAPDLHEPG
ncbi:MAG TPA: DUF4038 domain-containing protein [Ardenticatenaceae bacterium]|nr:DUF4038 domain-containing protein [Ardenticatenaceae bacterium]